MSDFAMFCSRLLAKCSSYRRYRGTKAPTGEDRRALLATRGLESGQRPAD